MKRTGEFSCDACQVSTSPRGSLHLSPFAVVPPRAIKELEDRVDGQGETIRSLTASLREAESRVHAMEDEHTRFAEVRVQPCQGSYCSFY